jgi:hypothetical protein
MACSCFTAYQPLNKVDDSGGTIERLKVFFFLTYRRFEYDCESLSIRAEEALEASQAKIYLGDGTKVMGRAGVFRMEWKRWGNAFVILRDLCFLSQIT